MQHKNDQLVIGNSTIPNCSSISTTLRRIGTWKDLFRLAVVALLSCVLMLESVALPVIAQNITAGEPDRSIKPGDDFYRYANGEWLRSVSLPADRSSYDTRIILREKTAQRVLDLVQKAAASRAETGSLEQKVGDYYSSILDQDAINSKGMQPLAEEMARIAAIKDKRSLSAFLGSTLTTEVDALIANSDHILGLWIAQGFHDAEHNHPQLLQGGLGMPDRESYIAESPEMSKLRAQYQAHIAAILKLAGIPDSDTRAAGVLALEIKIARAHATDADANDVFKQDNLWNRNDLALKAPGLDWDAYFKAAGLGDQSDFIVWHPTAVTGISALAASESVDVWKDYLKFHLIEHYASVLPAAVGDEDLAFYGKVLGTQQAQQREQAAVAATNGALGQAVGQLYCQRYFPPTAKSKVQSMVRDLIAAYRVRIPNIPWMSPETRKKALEKLDRFTIGVGYPDKWIDHSKLIIVRGDAFGNMRRAEAFYRSLDLAKMKQPADPAEWRINAQTIGAIIMFSPNSEFFAAGLFQPPFFDPQGDLASNYGSAGAAMAHEMTHSFDELGNIYDDRGRLAKWWTEKDGTEYHARTAKLVEQFNGYCPFNDLCVNGKQVMSENSADLAGLSVAHDAYVLSQKGKPDIVIDGLSGEQRFFLAFAQRWRNILNEGALRRQIATDIHSPGEYRSDTVRNLDAWYQAYKVAPADKLFLRPEDRVNIW